MKVTIIGLGNMGSAMVKAWLKAGAVSADDLTFFDSDPEKLKAFSAQTGDLSKNISESDVLVLAIKPQDLSSAAERFNPLLSNKTVILSILAGVSLDKLAKHFSNTEKIVRSMPNLGALVGESMNAFVATPQTGLLELASVEKLLSAMGPTEKLASENLMDAWCAVAGSGPGFIVAIMEAFVAAAVQQGFSAETAKRMVVQTFFGTGALVRESTLSLEALRQSVTSKGGTTAAGLEVFNSCAVAEYINQMVLAATKRGQELNSN